MRVQSSSLLFLISSSNILFFTSSYVKALMYDVIEASLQPPQACAYGCAPWANLASAGNLANQTMVNALWASPRTLYALI
jgi:hypothetical protein